MGRRDDKEWNLNRDLSSVTLLLFYVQRAWGLARLKLAAWDAMQISYVGDRVSTIWALICCLPECCVSAKIGLREKTRKGLTPCFKWLLPSCFTSLGKIVHDVFLCITCKLMHCFLNHSIWNIPWRGKNQSETDPFCFPFIIISSPGFQGWFVLCWRGFVLLF